jgi:threonylcarbamoyladenosine tRNA methylthiotransferase MtaB
VASYYIENFGCRASQADGSAIEQQLVNCGMHRVSAIEQAEVVVLNTCTVTAAADQDARAAIRRVRRQQPQARIMVTGCYAQRAPEEIAALEGVTWVVCNSHKQEIGRIVTNSEVTHGNFLPLSSLSGGLGATDAAQIYFGDIFAHTELHSAAAFEGIERTRPNLKVQDGCDNRCSFCVIPYVRGQSRSLSIEKVLEEVKRFEAAGYQEIVISGINLGRWGRDFDYPRRFLDLLSTILERTSIPKLRLSSIEPMDWTDDLIALMASSPRIARHAHLPLQSGSDRILRQMHRKYRPWHYEEKVEEIRYAMPDAAIGADVMVGFPGETEELFEESRRFIERLPFTYLHVFTYSPRPGTPAAAMREQVALRVARDRNAVLRRISAEKNLNFRRRFVGKQVTAITLRRADEGCTEALSENYLKVSVKGECKPNRWMTVHIDSLSDVGLSGTAVSGA